MAEPEKASILVVDDTPVNLQVLLEELSDAGFRVFVAESGERALVQVEYSLPDLILLDIMMPGIDGFETLRQLKKKPAMRDVPVIFMTALSETVNKVRGFELGAVDYITKPFSQEELYARVKTHLRLRRLQQELELANQNKNIFFSLIAHDVRAPLNSLSFAVDALVKYGNKAPKKQILEQIHAMQKSSLRLAGMIESLLDWAKLQMQHQECRPQEINLTEIIQSNIELITMTAQEKSIQLRQDTPSPLPAYADRDMIDTVLRNLLSNAVKFTQTGGDVEVNASAVKNENAVQVSVKDTGVGIPPEKIGRLFKIETRFTTPGTQEEKGSGIGLLLCRDMVEANGGKIWAESQPGKGSVFTFRIPKERPIPPRLEE